MLKVVCLVARAYVHSYIGEVVINTNMVEIHEEMSDKQVYVLNECF